MLPLIVFSVLWGVTFVYYYKKKGTIDAGNLIIFMFLVYSIFSVLLFLDKAGRGATYSSYDISLVPLIYLYLMVLLTMSPILKFDLSHVHVLKGPNHRVLDVISYIFIIASLIKLPNDISHIRMGISTILFDSAAGLDIYKDVMANSQLNLGDGVVSNIPAIITNVLSDFMCLVLMYYIIIRKNWKMIVSLSFALFTIAFGHLANSQRGPAISIILSMLVSYCVFRQLIEKRFRKKIGKVAIVAFVAFAIPFMAISHSRFDRSEGGVSSSFLDYAGQANLNFSEFAFDNNGIRNGDRIFPMFKRILGFDNVPRNFWERREKYPNLRINDEVFIGYVGDFVLDFGPFLTALLFMLFSFIFLKLTTIRNRSLYFHQLVVLHFLMILGIQGGMKLFPFADAGNLKIIMYAFLYVYFFINSKNSINIVISNGE